METIKKVFDTVGNEVKTQQIDGDLYLVGKQKGNDVYLSKADGKGLVGCYEGSGNILVERETKSKTKASTKATTAKVTDVSAMSADDKLAALSAKGKADGFVKMSNANGEGSIWKMLGGVPTPVEDKEIEKLLGVILDQDYIHNMKIDRSWILPQMKNMLFDPKTGRMETDRYREQVKRQGINKAWELLLHNLKVMKHIRNKDPKAYELMRKVWNKSLAIDMAENDRKNAKAYVASLPKHKCNKYTPGGLEYVTINGIKYGQVRANKMYFTENAEQKINMCLNNGWYYAKEVMKTRTEQQFVSDLWDEFSKRVMKISTAYDLDNLLVAVEEYIDNRIKYPMKITKSGIRRVGYRGARVINVDEVVFEATFPEEYISAYKADGAYYSMRTLLRYFGKNLGGKFALKSTHDTWMKKVDDYMNTYAPCGEGYKVFGFFVREFLPAVGLTHRSDFDKLKK